MIDCIIIGSSVAGISAALTLKANSKEFLLLGSKDLSPKIYKAEKIKNYPAFLGESGEEMCRLLQEQLKREEIEIIQARVLGVYAMKEKFIVSTQDGGMYESKTVVLACGVETGKRIDGETEFLGRGVSYCATCDGFLYKNKKIAVVSTSKAHEHEAEYLFNIAQQSYYFPLFKGAKTYENVQNIVRMPTKIVGEKRVNGLVYKAEKEITLEVDGVFVLKDSLPPETLVAGLETEGGHVKIDRLGRTNLAGCFAAGDVTGRPYQYAKAVGEGNVAAHSVIEYLSKN